MEGYNESDAVDRIRQTCTIVLNIKEVSTEGPKNIFAMDLGGNKLNAKAFTLMCSQFAIILRSGIPIARTCQLIAQKTSDKPLKKMLKKVASDVEAGRSLAAALKDHGGKLLPPTFIETIHSGEESGNLDSAFESTYKHFDKQIKMKSKVKNAMSYPLFVICVAIVVVIVLMVKVVPTFISIFEGYGSELPVITQALVAVSNFFRKFWIPLVVIILAVVIVYKIYSNTEEGRLKTARAKLKLPVIGNITSLNGASQFANTMTTMMAAGLPITKSISITAKVMDNYYLGQEIGKLTGRLEEGHSLGDSMRESGCMPDILNDMVAVGEETGELEETLGTVSAYYDAELDQAVTQALAKLEPAALLVIAGIAGFIVLAVYIAMFKMYAIM